MDRTASALRIDAAHLDFRLPQATSARHGPSEDVVTYRRRTHFDGTVRSTVSIPERIHGIR